MQALAFQQGTSLVIYILHNNIIYQFGDYVDFSIILTYLSNNMNRQLTHFIIESTFITLQFILLYF